MALSSNNLTDIGLGKGVTANFVVQYETSLPNQANVIRNANALLGFVEAEFNATTAWFGTPANRFGAANRQRVLLNKATGSGANNSGYGSAINMDAQGGTNNAANAAAIVGMIFINEWVEILMSAGAGWNAGDSSGEGLSQYCGIVRFQAGHYLYYSSWVDTWLNTLPRQDWVSSTEGTDGNAVSFGCALAFIYYLNVQLNLPIGQILAAGASNLAATYRTLTGDSSSPYQFFAGLLEHVFPSSATAAVPGPVTDDPYLIARTGFWADKTTFGKDEVQDAINTTGGRWSKAFWFIVEGFSKDSFNALGIGVAPFTGPFAGLNGVTIEPNPDIDFENAASPKAPQRIRIPFDIVFTAAAFANFPASGSTLSELDGSLVRAGTAIPGSSAAMEFELVAGADPYFTNINPSQNNVFYLSQDLRIFTAVPGENSTPVPGGPSFANDTIGGAYTYVQQLLGWLNASFADPGGTDPFASVLPSQGSALDSDSSVAPYSVNISNPFNIQIFNNYSFAIARVRLRGTSGPAGAASDVRVFFRLWSTETADTDFQPGSTYPSNPDAAGFPGFPLVGSGHGTLPFFASGNGGGGADYGAAGPNIRTMVIPSGDAVWAYFGCFLNLYDGGNVIDGRPIQQWLNGTHHCIVAQIAYDGAPVNQGNSPEASDKLAQRNLQVTRSDNPGPADTHRIPQTFDIRPSVPIATAFGPDNPPDELMIDWGGIPAGSLASIYWPQVNASDVLALAARLYGSHTLTSSDPNTLQVAVTGGVTYVPIPASAGENFAGLFTVDLPQTIVTGQEFNIVVRRVSSRSIRPKVVIKTLPSNIGDKKKVPSQAELKAAMAEGAPSAEASWRYVVGTFQVTIPVEASATMLGPEQDTLAIMRWRLENMAPSDRWRPVIERYIGYIAGRVDGLGGDSSQVPPSPDGYRRPQAEGGGKEREFSGRVSEAIFDCRGKFEGFVLIDCGRPMAFRSCEKGIAELVLRACREDLEMAVVVAGDDRTQIRRVIVRCC